MATTATARPTRRSCARWVPTAGSPWAGPIEYGGQGGSALEQLIFTDEAAIAGAPVPFLTINTVGPTIMRYGTEEQKAFFLPKIAAGELHFAIGYSEPGAGTDLASLRTRAVRDGDEYVINGQKMWTSADPVRRLRLARLPHRPRGQPAQGPVDDHRADRRAAGFSWTPVHTMSGPTTSATYYDDVRVPRHVTSSARSTAAGR